MKKFALLAAAALVATIAALSSNTGAAKAASTVVQCGGGMTASIVHSFVTAPIPMQASWNFTTACVQHDKCYAHFDSLKSTCDNAFLAGMYAVCKHYPAQPRTSPRYRCENVAGLYRADFDEGGLLQYQAAQKKAAIALFNGEYDGSGSTTAVVTGPDAPPFSDTEAIPSLTVADGMDNGTPLVVTIIGSEQGIRTVTAVATFTETIEGFTVTETDTFSYQGGGNSTLTTVQSTISGGGAIDGTDATATATGSFSGTKQ